MDAETLLLRLGVAVMFALWSLAAFAPVFI